MVNERRDYKAGLKSKHKTGYKKPSKRDQNSNYSFGFLRIC